MHKLNKHAPRAWFNTLHKIMQSFGFTSAKSDKSLFIRISYSSVVYVIICRRHISYKKPEFSSISACSAAEHLIFSKGSWRVILLSWYTSHVHWQWNSSNAAQIHIWPSQKGKYVHGKEYAYSNAQRLQALQTYGWPFDDPSIYRSIVGALQYVIIKRHSLSYFVNQVYQFMQAQNEEHWKCVKRILRYLKGMPIFGLNLRRCSDMNLTAFSDAD